MSYKYNVHPQLIKIWPERDFNVYKHEFIHGFSNFAIIYLLIYKMITMKSFALHVIVFTTCIIPIFCFRGLVCVIMGIVFVYTYALTLLYRLRRYVRKSSRWIGRLPKTWERYFVSISIYWYESMNSIHAQ